ncbi:hypothetical protein ACFSKU_12260 [Pontibacter silvestris]|uniref:Uncharacterized protein n=1 Tax=Pontibacter silvestris TaxID=2305183 RepID=A0ABW4X0F6_9BACT|nr:hypothetical protein [Pontibacter silvestris]MCC9135207.1 hypothetical protein [Pontibacter silvestris]
MARLEPLWQRMGSKVLFQLKAEIIDFAEHFHDFGSIYDKVHKAKELGETLDIISTRSLALLFV